MVDLIAGLIVLAFVIAVGGGLALVGIVLAQQYIFSRREGPFG